ncbi:MAG: hypothetical protein QOE99_393 [Actinomycetota bacterium]|nr:hypothetical protein [Actinomycetota bacterium]
MRRLIVWIASTAAGVVLLFSYSTSTAGPGGHKLVTGLAPVGVVPETAGPAPKAAATLGPAAPAAHAPAAASPVPSAAPTAARATSPSPRAQAPAVGPSPRPAASPAAPPQPQPTPAPKKTAASTRTINGAPADTRYGPVQVQIKMSGTRIVSSTAIVYPTDSRRDQEINSQAIPQLNDETVQAQSANIDTVSGATYTSDGYRTSLQSALDAAHQ